MDGGVLPLLSPEVHDQLLCFVDHEGDDIFLASLRQGSEIGADSQGEFTKPPDAQRLYCLAKLRMMRIFKSITVG